MQVPVESRREHRIPWSWLWAFMRVLLRTELCSSEKAVCALDCWAISATPEDNLSTSLVNYDIGAAVSFIA